MPKNARNILCLLLWMIAASEALGQYQTGVFHLEDGKQYTREFDENVFLNSNRLLFRGNENNLDLTSVKYFTSGGTTYYVKSNIEDSEAKLVLVQKAIAGTLSYYTLPRGSSGKRLFVEKEGNFQELTTVRREVTQQRYQTIDQYKGILKVMMADCEGISEESIDNTSLVHKQVFELVERYNEQCGDTEFAGIVRTKAPQTQSVSLMAGFGFSKIPFDCPCVSPETDSRFHPLQKEYEIKTQKPVFGAGYNTMWRKFSLHFLLSYDRSEFDTTAVVAEPHPQDFDRVTFEADMSFAMRSIRSQFTAALQILEIGELNFKAEGGAIINFSKTVYRYNDVGVIDPAFDPGPPQDFQNNLEESSNNTNISPILGFQANYSRITLGYQYIFFNGVLTNIEDLFADNRFYLAYQLFSW